MKNIFIFFISFILFILCINCSNDNNVSTMNDAETIAMLKKTLDSGIWTISLFINSETNQAAAFYGYDFVFSSDNKLIATNGSNSYIGTWSLIDSHINNDGRGDINFNISFSSPDNFKTLTAAWKIGSFSFGESSGEIHLERLKTGENIPDNLTFMKKP